MVIYQNHKELIDQTLHMLYCAAIALLCMIGRPFIWAIPIALFLTYGVAMLREYGQHNRIIWWSWDLSWSLLGAILGTISSLFIVI